MDSTGALDLQDVPKTLLVIGGGYIGLELGSVYAALGSKVTVVEMTPGLLPGADRDLVAVLQKRIEKMCDAVLLNTKVVGVNERKDGLAVTFEDQNLARREQVFDKVLVSVGRRPLSMAGLDKTKAEVDARGFIKVDARRRTAEPTIYAIGDVAGEPMLAHKASHEGRVAVQAMLGEDVVFEPAAIPAVVFTDPELAWAGLTETEAQKLGRKVEIAKFPWAASGRALTLDRTDGLTKLVIEPGSERVLGVGIVGPGAGEMIAEGTLAIEMGAVASDLALTIHAHPTLSENVMEVGRDVLRPGDARLSTEAEIAVLRCWSATVLRCGAAVRCCGAVLRCGAAVRCCGFRSGRASTFSWRLSGAARFMLHPGHGSPTVQ